MPPSLYARADAAHHYGQRLCSQTAEMIARSREDRRMRCVLADSIRFSTEVERLISEAIDDLDVDDAAALLSESQDLKAGIASVRDSLTRAPWVFR